MSRAVYRILIVLHASLLLVVSPASAADPSSEARDDFDRWIPSLGLTFGFTSQKHKGSVDSAQVFSLGGTDFFFPLEEREFNDSQNHLNTLQVGGTVELQTPQLVSSKWSPRIFIGGEILNVSSQRRQIAREGDPSTLREPIGGGSSFPDKSILGQGQGTTSDADTVLYGANIGVSVPVQIGDWRVKVKPQARYLNQEIYFEGVVLDARRLGIPGNDPTRNVEIRGNDSLDVHALGPGLEIEVDAARVGSISASVFISGGAYRVLSDRKVAFSNRARDNLDSGTFQGNWTGEIDPWIYRANLGFRVRWLGFSSGWLGGGN